MRKEWELDLESCEKLFLQILKAIDNFRSSKKLEEELARLVGKDLSNYNIKGWWDDWNPHEEWLSEYDKSLAGRLTFPDPPHAEQLSREEVVEILEKIKRYKYGHSSFLYDRAHSFYVGLLRNYFPNLKLDYVDDRKVKRGYRFNDYTIEELADKLISEKDSSPLLVAPTQTK